MPTILHKSKPESPFNEVPFSKYSPNKGHFLFKVEISLKGNLDSIPSPSPSMKIQIVGGKVCLRYKGKTLLGVVNKLLKKKVS